MLGGLSQHQVVPQAAPSSGQPRPISRLGRIYAGRSYRACVRHRCRRRVPAALYACERLQLGLVALLQAPPRPAAAAAAEAARLALLLQLRARAPSGAERPATPSGAERPATPTEESGALPPPLARPVASRRGMRSRNAFIDSELASGQYGDSFADLEDFIVCKRGRQY